MLERKIQPIQPYIMLNVDNYKQITSCNSAICSFYEFTVSDVESRPLQAVPDGSTDFLFGISINSVRTFVGGTVLKVKKWEFEENVKYFGVRFYPGVAPLPKDICINDVVNNDIEIDYKCFGDNLAERIAQANSIEQRANTIINYYCKNNQNDFICQSKRNIEQYIKDRIYQTKGAITIKEIANESGYSECYIRRVFETIHGISPKIFECFVRFQQLLNRIKQSNQFTFDEIALDCGYFDQSHMIKEFKSFSGLTPEKYAKLFNC